MRLRISNRKRPRRFCHPSSWPWFILAAGVWFQYIFVFRRLGVLMESDLMRLQQHHASGMDMDSSSNSNTAGAGAGGSIRPIVSGERISIPTTQNPPLTRRAKQRVSVFFNVYVPPTDNPRKGRFERVSWGIVSEQLQQISRSYVGTQNTTIFFTLVGRYGIASSSSVAAGGGGGGGGGGTGGASTTSSSLTVDQNFIDDLCDQVSPSSAANSLKCILSNTIPWGGELDTLSNLHEFCARNHHQADDEEADKEETNTKVVYLHNKGSYHPYINNDRWRRSMTDAIMSRDCAKPPDESCNVCGLQFSAPPRMFTMLFPGNFFIASCKYIRRLHHPMEYKSRMTKLAGQVQKLESEGFFHFLEKGEQPWVLGTSRWRPEHWIGSHPLIEPCDMSSADHPNYWYWTNHDHTVEEFQWSMYRDRRFNDSDEYERFFMADTPELRLKTYILLPGLLWRYVQLYNQTPPDDSWIYDRLPDGNFWKQKIQKHGHRAVNNRLLTVENGSVELLSGI